MFAERNYHFPFTIRPPTKMAEKTAAKNKRVSQSGLSTHNQDHEINPVTLSTAKISNKATIGSIPGRLVRLDSLFICIITSNFQFAKHPYICKTQSYFSSILSKSRLIFLRIKYVQEITREISNVTAV